MLDSEQRKPFEQAVRSWQDVSTSLVNGFGRFAGALLVAQTQFWTGAIHASADIAVDFSDMLANVPSKRRTHVENTQATMATRMEDGIDDAVNVADVMTKTAAKGMHSSARLLTGSSDAFVRHFRNESAS